MKKWIFILVIGFAIQCQDYEEAPSVVKTDLDGRYQGAMIRTRTIQFFMPKITFDTVLYSIEIRNGRFENRPQHHYSCEGLIETKADTILFESNSCGCWCNCDPLGFCIGDIILGKYVYQLREDSLLMESKLYLGTKENWYLKKVVD